MFKQSNNFNNITIKIEQLDKEKNAKNIEEEKRAIILIIIIMT